MGYGVGFMMECGMRDAGCGMRDGGSEVGGRMWGGSGTRVRMPNTDWLFSECWPVVGEQNIKSVVTTPRHDHQ